MTAHDLDSPNPWRRSRWIHDTFPVETLWEALRPQSAPRATINLRDWFPPGDEVAAKMAALVIIREDLARGLAAAKTGFAQQVTGHDPAEVLDGSVAHARDRMTALG